MDEADFICDRVAILDHGRVLCEDSPEALKRGLAPGERAEIETDRVVSESDRAQIEALGTVNWRSITSTVIEFQSRPGEGVGRRAAQLLEEQGYRVLLLTIAPVTLEDVFFSYTGRALRESGRGKRAGRGRPGLGGRSSPSRRSSTAPICSPAAPRR